MFENLSDKLDRAFKLLKGQGKISEINVAETLKEVRKALLDADVVCISKYVPSLVFLLMMPIDSDQVLQLSSELSA